MSQTADKRPGNVVQPINSPSLDHTAHETNPVISITDTPPAPSFAPPAIPGEVGRLGSYRIIKQLGRGGMGAVYLAYDTRLDRRLALKIMLPQYAADAEARERFLREAQAAAKVAHDNVITIYEADERERVPYIAMQFLQGYPLDDYLEKKGNLTIPQILRVARETAAGLAAAHRMGLVHRDIKPANLWLEAPTGRVKVLDFGLAKPVNTDIELTKSGLVVGTPAYMSPEQGRGLKVDHRTDLFSLGAVLYRLCTGQVPFLGSNAMAVLMALGTEDPPAVRELNPEVPEPLAALIHQLLEKNPNDRPQSAEEVASRARAIAASILSPTATQAVEKQSQYQVVYVPVEITVPPQSNPFSELDEAEGVSGSLPKAEIPKPSRQKMSGKGMWIAAGLASLLAIAAVGAVIIIIKNRDGTETKIELPDDATVTIKGKDGKTLALVKPNGKQPADGGSIEPTAAADSKAVDYVLLMCGYVQVNGDDRAIKDRAELPKERYTLTGVNLYNNKAVVDEGLKVFKDCKSLRYLHLAGTLATDAGLANFKDCKDLTFLELGSTQATDAGLANFGDCKNLTYLSLHSTKLTDAGLVHFKECKKLTNLHLYHTAITDAGLACFDGCTNLRELDLDATPVTDAGLVHFKDCKEITSLDLSSIKIGDNGLANFKGCENMRRLNLERTQLTDEGLANFQGCKELRLIRLHETKVTDGGLAYLKGCKMLSEIYLDGTGVTDAGAANLKEFAGLWVLSLTNTQVSGAGLTNIKNCKNLSALFVQKTKVSASFIEALHKALPKCKIEHDNGTVEPVVGLDRIAAEYVISIGGSVKVNNENREIKAAAELPQDQFTLTGVNLGRNKLATDAEMANLKHCKSLVELHLNNTNVTDVGLANFKGNENLAFLVLSEIQLTDVGLENFKDCKKLTYLDLTFTKVTDTGLSYVKGCDNLTFLSLVGAPITDAGLANFKGCKNLTRLDLTSTPVTDAGLANFKDCKKLMFLHLPNTQLTDAGLENFKDCKNLGWLTLRGTRVTDAGLAHFKDCKKITNLLLDNTATTDVGLAYFKDCLKLVELDVKKTQVSREFIVEFGQAHPLCRILHDGGTIEKQ